MANLSTAPLRGNRFAVLISHFAPLHAHLERVIYDLAARYDGVVLVMAGHADADAGLIGLTFRNRYRYLREAFSDDAAISPVKLVGESGGGVLGGGDPERSGYDGTAEASKAACPDRDGSVWIGRLRDAVCGALADPDDTTATFTVVTDIGDVDALLRGRWPRATTPGEADDGHSDAGAGAGGEHADASRPVRDGLWSIGSFIGGSEELQRAMRERPHNHEYWSIINHAFRREFTTAVLVVGSASVGKTTMVTRLSKLYDAPVSVEYAREFEERYNVDDDELTAFDYQRLILSKIGQNEMALASPANNGIVFLDTDAMVTKVYAERYLPPEENAKLQPTFDMVIPQERPALVLVVPPITEYVDDGFRAMQWASDRYEFHRTLMRVLGESPYADRVVVLDDPTYAARDEHAITVIRERTGFAPRPMTGVAVTG